MKKLAIDPFESSGIEAMFQTPKLLEKKVVTSKPISTTKVAQNKKVIRNNPEKKKSSKKTFFFDYDKIEWLTDYARIRKITITMALDEAITEYLRGKPRIER